MTIPSFNLAALGAPITAAPIAAGKSSALALSDAAGARASALGFSFSEGITGLARRLTNDTVRAADPSVPPLPPGNPGPLAAFASAGAEGIASGFRWGTAGLLLVVWIVYKELS